MWPMLLDTPKDECKRTLRRFELEAYASLVTALRGQGELSKTRRQLLQDAANTLHISTDRHRAEVRRAVNDERLATIAERLAGPNTEMDWAIEGRRLIPLMPRLPPQTAFTALANSVARLTAAENAKLPPPQNTARYTDADEVEEEAAAPESSRTTQNQVAAPQQAPQQMQIKVEESETRKRRRSSLEVPGQPISPNIPAHPPPSKILNVGPSTSALPSSSRTLTIPMNVAPVKLSISTTRPTSTISTPTTTQKVIIMSSTSNMSGSGSPSLLQRSLSVPLVKTTMAHLSTISSTGSIVSSNIIPSRVSTTQAMATTSGYISAAQGYAPRIRPKCTTPATVLPRGRGGSIVIPLTPNTPSSIPSSGLQLKPVATASSKPTLHIKQDGSGMKIIAGAPKLMPKPPTVAVATTTGTTRLVTLTATPRMTPTSTVTAAAALASSGTTLHPITPQSKQSMGTPTTATLVGQKQISHLNMTSTASNPGKANVIVVKKGTSYPVGQGVTLAQGGRELLGKVLLRTPTSLSCAQKTSTPQTQTLSGTRQGNVIVVDLSQEQRKATPSFSNILQTGVMSSVSTTPLTPIQTDKREGVQDIEVLNEVIKEVESVKQNDNDDSLEIQEITQESMDVEEIIQSSIDSVPQTSILDELCSSQEAVKVEKICTSSQEDLSQSILARTLTRGGGGDEYQRAVREACQEESSISLDELKEKPEIIESVSQESQISVPTEILGELDPQTGIFCGLQEDSTSSTSGVARTVDIYSAAISSANITFDSNSETEPEIPESVAVSLSTPILCGSDDEDISLVYHDEPEEIVETCTEVVKETEAEPTVCETSANEKVLVEVLNTTAEDLLEKQLEELEASSSLPVGLYPFHFEDPNSYL
ncbi:hypothetical protein B566_EDAN010544 [Ephemera danica]|nr:hypothetical protein B566_EDAN010544 [Ephemera danica]